MQVNEIQINPLLITEQYDTALRNIDGLTWLPWIGSQYDTEGERVLIIGESHYNYGEDVEFFNKNTIKDLYTTRKVVEYYPVEHIASNPMFENLLRFLTNGESFNRESLWSSIAFYNFIQRPLSYNKNSDGILTDRPDKSDWEEGWNIFIEIAKILKPTYCVFVGTTFSWHIPGDRQFEEYCTSSIKREKVGRYYTAKFDLGICSSKIRCIAIKHTSKYFSWKKWNRFLWENYPELVAHIDKTCKQSLTR